MPSSEHRFELMTAFRYIQQGAEDTLYPAKNCRKLVGTIFWAAQHLYPAFFHVWPRPHLPFASTGMTELTVPVSWPLVGNAASWMLLLRENGGSGLGSGAKAAAISLAWALGPTRSVPGV